jgi:hypothetical protein
MSIHRPKRVTYRSSREPTAGLDETKEDSRPVGWQQAMEGKAEADFKPYAVAGTFSRGDLVRHPKFGNGVVTAVEAGKIEVLFEDGSRKLAHAM